MAAKLSEGAARLAAKVSRSSAASIARKLGANEATVRHWASGRRKPTGPGRATLHSQLGIAPSAWDVGNTSSPASASPRRTTAPPQMQGTSSAGNDCDDLFERSSPEVQAEIERIAGEVRAFAAAHLEFTPELWAAIMPWIDPEDMSIWTWPIGGDT
jgi:hypothetical protein